MASSFKIPYLPWANMKKDCFILNPRNEISLDKASKIDSFAA